MKLYRELQAGMHSSIFYFGPLKESRKRSAADFDPFESQDTYGKRFEKNKDFRTPNLKKHKLLKDFQPKEMWEVIGVTDEDDPNQPKKKLALSTKKNLDKLAKFDDDVEDRGGVADANDDEDEAPVDEDADEGVEVPRDDDFKEDADDVDDDYNAEQYFDAGDQDFDDGGGGNEYGDDY